MSLRKRHNLVLLAVIHLLVLAAFLPGCKEGTKTSPASVLLNSSEQAEIDLSQLDDATHAISGKVVSKTTSEKLDNVSVNLFFESKLAGVTKTTSDGTFYFAKLPPAIYDLSFSKDAYALASYVIRIMTDGTLSPSSPEVALAPTTGETIKATLEGNVIFKETNQPLANLNVELFSENNDIPIKSSLTNSLGNFSFTDLQIGSYTAKIGKDSAYAPKDQEFKVYNGGIVSPKLAIVTLETMTSATYSISISGYVKAQTNESIPSFKVTLYNDFLASISTSLPGNPTQATGEGKFFFENITVPGMYFLVASAASFTTTEPFAIRILPDGTTSPANIEIPIIRITDEANKCNISITINDAFSGGPIEYANAKINGFDVATTDLNGKFKVNLLPGTYKIEIAKFGYEALSSSFLVEATASMSLTYPLIHSLKIGYGSIAGRYVNTECGSGISSATVYLYKWILTEKTYWDIAYTASETWIYTGLQSKISKWELESENPILITKTGTASDLTPEYQGSFKLTHLEPGKYLVYITETGKKPVIQPPTYTLHNEPAIVEMPLDKHDLDAGLYWRTLVKDKEGFVIYNLEVEAGNTTYWTNYEQAYK